MGMIALAAPSQAAWGSLAGPLIWGFLIFILIAAIKDR